MNQAEAIRQRHEELQQKRDEQQKLLDESEQDVQQAQEEVGGRLDEAESEREQALNALPEQTRDTFLRLAEAYEGEAMAPIEEEVRRRIEYSCGGCFISLPIEHVNAVATKPDRVTTCPNCRRILYVGEDLKAAMKPKS